MIQMIFYDIKFWNMEVNILCNPLISKIINLNYYYYFPTYLNYIYALNNKFLGLTVADLCWIELYHNSKRRRTFSSRIRL